MNMSALALDRSSRIPSQDSGHPSRWHYLLPVLLSLSGWILLDLFLQGALASRSFWDSATLTISACIVLVFQGNATLLAGYIREKRKQARKVMAVAECAGENKFLCIG